MSEHSATADLLTVEEFADKLKVSRSTVFGWLKAGQLQEGKHFFRIGRIIRFVWDAGLFLKPRRRKSEGKKKEVRPVRHSVSGTHSQPGINLDYGENC